MSNKYLEEKGQYIKEHYDVMVSFKVNPTTTDMANLHRFFREMFGDHYSVYMEGNIFYAIMEYGRE